MYLNMSPTFKQFLQAKKVNAEKNISYYQQYDVKIMRAFLKQEMMEQQIYDNILVKQSEMHYSPIICLKTSLVNMDEAKSLTMSN